MRIYKDISLDEFEAWSGAVDTMDTLKQLENETGNNVFSIIESCIDDMGEGMDETTVNDILWFETDTIAEWLGYEDWEALEKAANGEEEEEIELEYSVGDVVNVNDRKAQIDEIDYTDRDLPYYVKYIDEDSLEALTFEQCGADELTDWEEEE